VLELFDESAGWHVSAKLLAHECTVGPPTTENHDANRYRDVDDEDSKVNHRKPGVFNSAIDRDVKDRDN
jgi:hypothetical protein